MRLKYVIVDRQICQRGECTLNTLSTQITRDAKLILNCKQMLNRFALT